MKDGGSEEVFRDIEKNTRPEDALSVIISISSLYGNFKLDRLNAKTVSMFLQKVFACAKINPNNRDLKSAIGISLIEPLQNSNFRTLVPELQKLIS